MTEHVFLVAFVVEHPDQDDRATAEHALHSALVPLLRSNNPASPIDSWWVAEDDRRDGSDNDSAVFVRPGSQTWASTILEGPNCGVNRQAGGKHRA